MRIFVLIDIANGHQEYSGLFFTEEAARKSLLDMDPDFDFEEDYDGNWEISEEIVEGEESSSDIETLPIETERRNE